MTKEGTAIDDRIPNSSIETSNKRIKKQKSNTSENISDINIDTDLYPADAVSFRSLGLAEPICKACEDLGFKEPTAIQRESIPVVISGRDVIGLAQTGSGKTAAFVLPILHDLLRDPKPFAALILAPTRELAIQIGQQAEALGSSIGLKVSSIVGGVDMVTQAISLSRKPHVVVGTPGRVLDHLEHTRGFSMPSLRFLVMDEADRLLNMDFGPEIDKILAAVSPSASGAKQRRTMLFSATMTGKVAKLQRASMIDPVRVDVNISKEGTMGLNTVVMADGLVQTYSFIPAKIRDAALFYLLLSGSNPKTSTDSLSSENSSCDLKDSKNSDKELSTIKDRDSLKGSKLKSSTIVFVATCAGAQRLAVASRHLGLPAVPLHGQLSQSHRLAALARFRAGSRSILFATDVASRGLDIPAVDSVINYDVPANGKDYVHRVGRTARAGRSGRSYTLVTQYDVESYQRIEALIGQKLPEYAIDRESVALLLPRIVEALRLAQQEISANEENTRSHKSNGRKLKTGLRDTDQRVEYHD